MNPVQSRVRHLTLIDMNAHKNFDISPKTNRSEWSDLFEPMHQLLIRWAGSTKKFEILCEQNRKQHGNVLHGFPEWAYKNYGITITLHYDQNYHSGPKMVVDGFTVSMNTDLTIKKEKKLFIEKFGHKKVDN
jgi:hypothetical protein